MKPMRELDRTHQTLDCATQATTAAVGAKRVNAGMEAFKLGVQSARGEAAPKDVPIGEPVAGRGYLAGTNVGNANEGVWVSDHADPRVFP